MLLLSSSMNSFGFKTKTNESVAYSREGDEFHYRWAARRCLKLLYPTSSLQYLIIEGSDSTQGKEAGEYVIDVAEYSRVNEDAPLNIAYYQLKHTTVQHEKPFQLSDLRPTIFGFAERYVEHISAEQTNQNDAPRLTFTIVTNRPISQEFKQHITAIGRGETIRYKNGKVHRFQTTLESYTKLTEVQLQAFCAVLQLEDSEGDYKTQGIELRRELSLILADDVDSRGIGNIVELVRKRVFSDTSSKIVREDVLNQLGITSDRALFPAPPEFELLDNPIVRHQHDTLVAHITENSDPLVIHAEGGVGKSVVAQQLAVSLPSDSLGIVYDCYGGGKYLKISEPRHRYQEALVQIANQLAVLGLCSPLLNVAASPTQIVRLFLQRLEEAVLTLRRINEQALLAIFIDAADNAVMAAQEFNEACFVHGVVREQMPDGCKLILLCRSERREHLRLPPTAVQVKLQPFLVEESALHLKRTIVDVTDADSHEFHRLTAGNPRVQANALNREFKSVETLLTNFSLFGVTVDAQIEAQLEEAIRTASQNLPSNYQTHVDAICTGLAVLPPFIPIDVLAAAADVQIEAVKSLVADLGRPIWLSDAAVHFRDEPTETWFRRKYSATKEQIADFILRIESFATESAYVAEALPSLLYRSGQYDKLVEVALEDAFLPQNNPIDERSIRIYRLQFAFKSALKQQRFADAIKLAIRAGEEVSGNKRQQKLLTENVDLIAPLQNELRVQELAFRHTLSSDWRGSEDAYSAGLLSSVDTFKGEARNCLRRAENWLRVFSNQEERTGNFEPEDGAILMYAYFNLYGVKGAIYFLERWKSDYFQLRIALLFVKKLVDLGEFDAIDQLINDGIQNRAIVIATAHELLEVGRLIPTHTLLPTLKKLNEEAEQQPLNTYDSYRDPIPAAILSFLEVAAIQGLSSPLILNPLDNYEFFQASRLISDEFYKEKRSVYVRNVALRFSLIGKSIDDLDYLIPEDWRENEAVRRGRDDIHEFKRAIGGLLPWYTVRFDLLVNKVNDMNEAMTNARQRASDARKDAWRNRDGYPYEVSEIQTKIFILSHQFDSVQANQFLKTYLASDKRVSIQDRLLLVRAAHRLEHLETVRHDIEKQAVDMIDSLVSEGSEARGGWFVDLARAVIVTDKTDARAYLDFALEAISKFGDEIIQRWGAIAAIGSHIPTTDGVSPELAYRFMRCAELIGDEVVREKYFDRDGAVAICARLAPPSAFSALSRWRDRDVGRFHQQLPALAFAMVESGALQPANGWALSAFFEGDQLAQFAATCIKLEKDVVIKQHIVDVAMRDVRLQADSKSNWTALMEAVKDERSIDDSYVHKMHSFHNSQPKKAVVYSENHYNGRSEQSDVVANKDALSILLDSVNLMTERGIVAAKKRVRELKSHTSSSEFWTEIYRRIPSHRLVDFLKMLVQAAGISHYDMYDAIDSIPIRLRTKPSLQRYWSQFLTTFAVRFAIALARGDGLEYASSRFKLSDVEVNILRLGVIEGLSTSPNLVDASTFFGFAEIGAAFIHPNEALELMDFALGRFELYIEPERADGVWDGWLIPPSDVVEAFAGFIWSALASPFADTRWRAAHCVRRLAAANCVAEIDALMEWLTRDEVGCFGSREFPFYNLHARMYLLIALTRIALDDPAILQKHDATFKHHALTGMSHILIQKFSAEIALSIEAAAPDTYDPATITQLTGVGLSHLAKLEGNPHRTTRVDTPWHRSGAIDLSLEFSFGMDIRGSWFEPLGRVFGVSAEQVEQVAREVIVKEWQTTSDGRYGSDPRGKLWESYRRQNLIGPRQKHYPRVDQHNFYLSYHSMLAVAAKFLETMPVLDARDGREDRWVEWLNRYNLTREDGRWLADRRDPAPLQTREWLSEEWTKNWRQQIDAKDFLAGILYEQNEEIWTVVSGQWEICDGNREETFFVSTALVSPVASQALLNALTTCPDPNDFKLPEYEESHMEFSQAPFELTGWTWRHWSDYQLDEFDPFGAHITYPPYQIGDRFIEQMNLSSDDEQRYWYIRNHTIPVATCELWSDATADPREDPCMRGERLTASLDFLLSLCKRFECELVFEAQIKRQFRNQSYSSNPDDLGSTHQFTRIYLLSADGLLRDTGTYYQLRTHLS